MFACFQLLIWYYGYMAARKMTFTIPEPIALRFVKAVPARNRSKYLAEALVRKLADEEEDFIHACEVANLDSEIWAIEKEFSALPDETTEPWTDAPAR